MKRITVTVADLGYEHSRIGLARQLRGRDGILHVDADVCERRAMITYAETRLNRLQGRRMIAKCGYDCPSNALSVEARDDDTRARSTM